MNVMLSLFILSALNNAPIDERPPDADEVFYADFGEQLDQNYDLWPDLWTRRRDGDHPRYLPIKMVDDEGITAGRSLRIDLDGGAATVYTPAVPVGPEFSYVLEGWLRTEGLEHDVAYYSLTFFDDDRNPLATYQTKPVTHTNGWTKVRIGPVTPDVENLAQAVIALHIRPTEDDDLTGTVWFDDIWLARLPRMEMFSNNRSNVYNDSGNVRISCQASGILHSNPVLRFELLDYRGEVIDSTEMALEASVGERTFSIEGHGQDSGSVDSHNQVAWRPPIDDYGFYRIRATMHRRGDDGEVGGVMQQKEISLVVAPERVTPIGGSFGWSLPAGDDPLSLADLVLLLGQSGVNWVKFPVWYSVDDPQTADELAWFAERLSAERIELVGLLSHPPAQDLKEFGETNDLIVAGVFAATDFWQPLLDPVTMRLSLKIRWWQLGDDDDTSFVGYPGLAEKINLIREQLARFGQEVHVGIAWDWLQNSPKEENPPWDFLSFTTPQPLTADETLTYLDRQDSEARQWISLSPLPRGQYSADERVRDLVARMIAASIEGADGIFATDAFGEGHGLMNTDGTPSELFLPWRTTAYMLAGAEYLGSIQLPGGSHNDFFVRGDETIMVLWNETPVEEMVFLGNQVEQVNVWGRTLPVETREGKQVITAEPLPKFLTGMNLEIAKIRMSTIFNETRLASVFNRPQAISLHFDNPFAQGLGGQVHILTPEDWSVSSDPRFEAPINDVARVPIEILLRGDAASGVSPVRIDFEVNADQQYQFSVWRELQIGLGEIDLEIATRLDERGNLIVEQQMTNRTDKSVSFNCYLFASDRRRMRQQVIGLGRGRDKRTFVLHDAASLEGTTLWLRAEEINGQRVLNYRLDVRL